MKISERLSKGLKRHLTILFIPHCASKPFQVKFTIAFIIFMITLWSGVTIWAGYLSIRHIDYLKTKTEFQMMKLKINVFAKQIKKSEELLEQVKQNDQQVRQLLGLKTKKNIVESDGQGGPTKEESYDLVRFLEKKVYEMTQSDILRQTNKLLKASNETIESLEEVNSYVEKERSLFLATPSIWPTIGRLTSTFGHRVHPVFGESNFHSGIDIANEKNTPVYATAYGKVALCEWQPGYGKLIIINHGHNFQTYYGHLHKFLVKPGDSVKRGQLIGLMGETGTSTGNHLHYEVLVNSKQANPMRYMKKPSENVVAKN